MKIKQYKVIISGGGTGGHVFPAIAIAKSLTKLIPSIKILFVGALGKIEMEKVPLAGFKIIGLPISGIQRKFTLKNFILPFKIIKCLILAKKIIRNFNPDVVVGVGGYASGPIVRIASKKGIPILLQEQNSYPGLTNKILAKKATKICVAYSGMEKYFQKEKILITGNPVRPEIKNIEEKREEGINFFNLSKQKNTLLIIGGSLGATNINKGVLNALPLFQKLDIQIIWQTGKYFYEEANNAVKEYKNNIIFNVFKFIEKMDLAYSVADIIVSRAGAIAISELCLVKKPIILIPSPNVAEDHQTKNAMSLVNANAAILLLDKEAPDNLGFIVNELFQNKEKQNKLKLEISKFGDFSDADQKIANEIINLL